MPSISQHTQARLPDEYQYTKELGPQARSDRNKQDRKQNIARIGRNLANALKYLTGHSGNFKWEKSNHVTRVKYREVLYNLDGTHGDFLARVVRENEASRKEAIERGYPAVCNGLKDAFLAREVQQHPLKELVTKAVESLRVTGWINEDQATQIVEMENGLWTSEELRKMYMPLTGRLETSVELQKRIQIAIGEHYLAAFGDR